MSPVAVGDVVPPLERRFDRADLVAYAGATWDWHRLHHDEEYLAEKENRQGQAMLVVTSTASYRNQSGDLLTENEETLVYVSLAPGPS